MTNTTGPCRLSPSISTGRRAAATAMLVAFAISAALHEASAQGGERSGKEVVEATCSTCHATGAQGAPKIGNQRAWSKRASQGLTSLTESALKGIRSMPAHGGDSTLSDIEIERAITYMVNQSGGNWAEPVGGLTPAVERKGEQIVKAQCVKCHQTGVGGAPKIGDRDAWIPRLKQGLDLLVRSAINGHGPMPPRGGMADLTDSEIRGAIVYMFNPGGAPAKGPSTALPAAPDRNRKIVDGTEIYLGIVSAKSMGAQYSKGSKESSMHGGIPTGKNYYHVNISLFDGKTRAPIADAQVEASVREPVSGGETKKLELMTLNNKQSYGNYFRMSGTNPYTITVKIRKPGMAGAIEAKFDFKPY